MLESPSILGSNRDGPFDGFTIHVEWCLFPPVLVQLDIDGLAIVRILENDVDVDWSREKVRRHIGECDSLKCPPEEQVEKSATNR